MKLISHKNYSVKGWTLPVYIEGEAAWIDLDLQPLKLPFIRLLLFLSHQLFNMLVLGLREKTETPEQNSHWFLEKI